jgi:hypothetical protein
LPAQTQSLAAQLFAEVSAQYLEFRREYYHEEQPSLQTAPPSSSEVRQAEVARMAESTLRMLPKSLTNLPILGGLLSHLEQVASIHSLSEHDRTALHNMTMSFLYGTQGGIQPWYVEWLLASAHNLSQQTDPQYYMEYPWDALLYLDPVQLAQFDAAVVAQNVPVIEGELSELAGRLVQVLRDPVNTQVELAFTGPEAEERRRSFNLKTTAALALGALLVAEGARLLLQPHQARAKMHSLLAPLPPALAAHVQTGATSPQLT